MRTLAHATNADIGCSCNERFQQDINAHYPYRSTTKSQANLHKAAQLLSVCRAVCFYPLISCRKVAHTYNNTCATKVLIREEKLSGTKY